MSSSCSIQWSKVWIKVGIVENRITEEAIFARKEGLSDEQNEDASRFYLFGICSCLYSTVDGQFRRNVSNQTS